MTQASAPTQSPAATASPTATPQASAPPQPIPAPLAPPLVQTDRLLLHTATRLVPRDLRPDFLASWAAELWHARNPPPRSPHQATPARRLAPGLLADALWLRVEALRHALSGTALLCLATLSLLVALAALPALLGTGGWHGLAPWLAHQGPRFAAESLLILFVSLSTANAPIASSPAIFAHSRPWLRARVFQSAKVLLVLALAFLLSSNVAFPWQALLPLTAEFTQSTLFALLALLGLRWSFLDDAARCQHCLRALAAPARIGRPSRNFLEWNGTELLCPHGHGRLSIPELETSWCRSSTWLPLKTS